MSAQEPDPPRRAARRVGVHPVRQRSVTGAICVWLFDIFVLLVIALLLGFWFVVDRDLAIPDWAEAQIEARLAEAIAPARAEIGGLSAKVDQRGRASVQIADLTLRSEAGATLATLPKIAVTFDRDALWRGEVRPTALRVDGAALRLRRDPNGRFEFGIETAAPTTQIGSPQDAMRALEAVFAAPGLNGITEIDASRVVLDYRDDGAGRAWTFEDGRIRIAQDAETLAFEVSVAMPGVDDAPGATAGVYLVTQKAGETAQLSALIEGMPATDLAAHAPSLAWLGLLDAPVSGSLSTGIGPDGALGPLDGTLRLGAGHFRPAGDGAAIAFQSMRTAFAYRPDAARLTFDAFEVTSGPVDFVGRGHVLLEGLETGWPTALVAQVQVDRVTVEAPDVLEVPITFVEGAADAKITLDPFHIRIGQLTVTAPIGAVSEVALPSMGAAVRSSPPLVDRSVPPRVSLRPRAHPNRRPASRPEAPQEPVAKAPRDEGVFRILVSGTLAAGPKGWTTAVDVTVPEAAPQDVLALWPLEAIPLTRTWLGQSLLGGRVVEANAALRLAPEQDARVSINFGFEGGNVRVLPALPPVNDSRGFASIRDNAFSLTVAQGLLPSPTGGALDVSGSVFELDDVRKKPPIAHVGLRLDGPIPAVLWVLDQRPFEFMKKAGRAIDLAEGWAKASGTLDFPLGRRIRVADVVFNVDGVLRDVRSDSLVPDRVLTADELALTLRPDRLSIAGDVALDGIPATAVWTQPLGKAGIPATVTGQMEIGARAVEILGLGLPPDMVSGRGRADIALTLPKGAPPSFRLTSSLAGVGVSLPPLGWRMSSGATGRLEVAGRFSRPPVIETLSLTGPGLQATGQLTVAPGGGLEALRLSKLKVGRWLDAPVTLRGRGAGRAPAVTVSGGRADLRGLIAAGSSGSGSGGSPMAVRLDRLSINDSIALTAIRGDLTTAGGIKGAFTARVNGGAQIEGRLTPGRGGLPALRIDGENAGAVFASAGLFDKGQGGSLALALSPSTEPGIYDGQLRVKGVRVQSAPGLAALLNAISVVGLLDQLNGQGLLFSDVQAVFRLTPRAVQVISSSGTGPSVGITMEGIYDMARDRLDMQGVFSPAYALNGIGQIFTRRGEGLLGLTYTMRGTAKSPQVLVNPLSALTPGMFREIFRAKRPSLPGD